MCPLRDTALFQTSSYSVFLDLLEEKKYLRSVIKIYPNWVNSRGMGFFIPELQIEIEGTPHLRSYFQVENK
jgi:hypothetical protein